MIHTRQHLRRTPGFFSGSFCLGWLGLALALAACQGAELAAQAPRAEGDEAHVAYVVSHEWHAGIVLRRVDAPAAQWPGRYTFPEAEFLEVGWGDSAYYQHPDPGLFTTLQAGLWPTPSVLHVVGFSQPVRQAFPNSEIVRLELPPGGLEDLLAFIEAAFVRSEDDEPVPLGPGHYGDGRFYRARARYHALYNCNTWVAHALREAGLPLAPARAVTVGRLFDQLREIGTVLQAPVEAATPSAVVAEARYLPASQTGYTRNVRPSDLEYSAPPRRFRVARDAAARLVVPHEPGAGPGPAAAAGASVSGGPRDGAGL